VNTVHGWETEIDKLIIDSVSMTSK
jgi:uncharacterized membrane protein